MQRLANVANRVRRAMVFVQKAAAACEIEQRQAQQQSANLPPSHCARVFARRHKVSLHYYSSLDAALYILVLLYRHKSQFVSCY
jgi:hypothetical protein